MLCDKIKYKLIAKFNEKNNFYFTHPDNIGIYFYADFVFLVDQRYRIFHMGNSHHLFWKMRAYRL